MALKLKNGSALHLIIEPRGQGFRLRQALAVGRRSKDVGEARDVDDEAALWTALGRLADDRLARLGLERVK